jgi:predicted LPLAT superfamily acyltransferase
MFMLRVMTWISLRLGRPVGRAVLHLIASYFLLFSAAARSASRAYLRRALGRKPNLFDLYKHIFTFASTIHDRVYLINNRYDLFDITIHNEQIIHDVLAEGRGAFLVGAHLGSFEVIHAMGRRHPGLRTVMVMFDENARKINTMLAAINPSLHQDIIPLGHIDTMLKVRDRLNEGAVLSMLADRSLGDDATLPVPFLGNPAVFPTGPFRMAALLHRPVIFMTGLYLGANRYAVHFEALADFSYAPAAERDAVMQTAIERYAALLEKYCRTAPYNWFNFFDFWRTGPSS